MKLWNWLQSYFGVFPIPSRHILTYESIAQYWNDLTRDQQKQCKIYVYRIRKPTSPDDRANLWKVTNSDGAYLPAQWMIRDQLGRPGEIDDPYTIRIEREYETQPGVTVKEEVCIANFTMTM